jgi:hypothetical protein
MMSSPPSRSLIPHQLPADVGRAEIRLQREGPSPQRFDVRDYRRRHVRPTVIVDRHIRALARERERDRASDAVAAGAGDQRLPAVEPHQPPPS